MAGLVGVVEEEGAAIGVADVIVCEVFACRNAGWETEDFVMILGGGSFWHGDL